MPDEQLSKHERRQLKLQLRKEEKEKMQVDYQKKENVKKLATYGVIALVILSGAWFFLSLPKPPPVNYDVVGLSFPLGNIHWHATPTVTVCGETVALPKPPPGQEFGNALLHVHNDSLFHIEGSVSSPSQITLGAMMSNIGKNFSQMALLDKKNGDSCPSGKAGKVQLIINGVENNQYENYIIRDGDKIEMRFE